MFDNISFQLTEFIQLSSASVGFEQAKGFGIYLAEAMLNDRGDEILDLAKTNWRALL
ncbi:MAG TPA: hypothetical protein VN875_04970 [Candidatus Binatus sp.]|nr:hypothetical protein [Candidatus Binatus sp.]